MVVVAGVKDAARAAGHIYVINRPNPQQEVFIVWLATAQRILDQQL